MPHIKLLAREGDFNQNETVLDVIQALAPEYVKTALGCFSGGRALELRQVVSEDCSLYPITFQNEEGRRIYERSLRFVLLLAIERLYPGVRVRIEHSLGYGVYAKIIDKDLDKNDISKIENEMRHIIQEDLPFEKELWSRQQAIDFFSKVGETDKIRLLTYRPYDYFNIYKCGGYAEYFYGAMLPSTRYVKVFSICLNKPGFVLYMPSPANPDVPSPTVYSPKHLKTFEESNRWCRILNCTNAADLNDLTVKNHLRDFIRVNEALHDKSIAEIAQSLHENSSRAIFIAGPSSSGKTTFANRLCIHLRVLGLAPLLISLDDFYLNRNTLPLEADGKPDLEALTSLDLPLIERTLSNLLSGKDTELPHFDFKAQCRSKSIRRVQLTSDQPIIIEGIHALNPALHHGFDVKLLSKIYITELTCLNLDNHNRIRTTDARLLRRIVRDYRSRSTLPDETLSMWKSVRAGEEKWIFPYQEQADYIFNSALHYELPVLKNVAYELLKVIPPENPNYLMSRRLLKILHYFIPAPQEALREIPPLSLLREFIGGCTLYD